MLPLVGNVLEAYIALHLDRGDGTGGTMATTRTTTRDSGPRAWASLAVLVLPCLLGSMDGHVLNLALPQLSTQLRPSAPELLWIVDGYGFCIAGALLVLGALPDRVRRRPRPPVGAAPVPGR